MKLKCLTIRTFVLCFVLLAAAMALPASPTAAQTGDEPSGPAEPQDALTITRPALLATSWTAGPATCFDLYRFDAEFYPYTGLVYILGGRTDTSTTNGHIYSVNPVTGACADTGAVMPTPVSNYTISLVDNGTNSVLCTFGGRKVDNSLIPDVQCYNPITNTATVVTSLPAAFNGFQVGGQAVLNDLVYLFGGGNTTSAPYETAVSYRYNPQTNAFTPLGNLSQARQYINAAVVDGKIYAMGGETFDGASLNGSTRTEVMADPGGTGTWNDTAVAELPTAMGEGRAFGFNTNSGYDLAGKIILTGGHWATPVADATAYDVKSNTYDTTFPDMQTARRNQAGVFVPTETPDPADGLPGIWVYGGYTISDNVPHGGAEFYPVLGPAAISVSPPSLDFYVPLNAQKTKNTTLTAYGGQPTSYKMREFQPTAPGGPTAGCVVAIGKTGYDSVEEQELYDTLNELGVTWIQVNTVAEARDAGAKVLLHRYASFNSITVPDTDAWINEGHGFVKLGSYANWFAYNLISFPNATPINLTVSNPSHPLMAGLPASWSGKGFWAYDLAIDLLGYATNAAYPNLIQVDYGGTTYQRVVTAVEQGSGRAAYIGFNTYGSAASSNDKMLLSNAIRWSGNCTLPSDVPWLSENPVYGTTATQEQVLVTTNSTGLALGDYSANLGVESNDPLHSLVIIPVTMHVATPGVTLGPDASLTARPGDTIFYTVSLTNTGTSNDIYTLGKSSSVWSVSLPSSVTVAAGATANFTVSVTVPQDAAVGSTDPVTITATSAFDDSVKDGIVLTTVARESDWRFGTDVSSCFDFYRFDAEFYPGTGLVYILGGRKGTDTDGRIFSFNPASGACVATGAVMPTPISNYTINRINNGVVDLLCTFGGRKADGTMTTDVQCYNPNTNTISIVATLPGVYTGYLPGGQEVVNNRVYVFGGYQSSFAPYTLSATFRFNPLDNTFTPLGNLSLARGYINTAVVNGKIYAMGGTNYDGSISVAQNRAEVMADPGGAGTWDDAAVSDLPMANGEGRAFGFDSTSSYSLAGKIVIIGGGMWPNETAEAFTYDVATNTYDLSYPDLLSARRDQAAAFVSAQNSVAGDGLPALWVFGGRHGSDYPPYAKVEYYPLAPADIRVTPAGLDVAVPIGSPVQNRTLTITSNETQLLSWSMHEYNEATPHDFPWLSASLVSGVTYNHTQVTISVDPTGLAGGIYHANLGIQSNDPDDSLHMVPITLTIQAASVNLEPATMSLSGEFGTVVQYTVTVKNTGNSNDTFTISTAGNSWVTTSSPGSIALAAGSSGSFQVNVTVPANATDGAVDTATVTATSTLIPTVKSSVTIKTQAKSPVKKVYLPVIGK